MSNKASRVYSVVLRTSNTYLLILRKIESKYYSLKELRTKVPGTQALSL
jgi:hypothetical protein